MKTTLTLGGVLLGSVAVFLGQFNASALPGGGDDGAPANGPDVIVGAIPDVSRYSPGTYQGVQYASYALGSTSCNIGNQQLLWQPNPDPDHPVIPQNMYRIKDGAIEQIGMSWVKHGFCALQQTLCGSCQPADAGCPTVLGIGCSDPYTASLNGNQSDLKSRGPINAATGIFSGTYSDPAAPTGLPLSLRERVMVARSDLDPAQNPGAVYIAEAQYIHPQDAAAGNAANNASYRRFTVGSNWSSSQGYPLTLTGPTVQQLPAIYGWQSVHADVVIKPFDVIGDGRMLLGSRAIDLGNGMWRYEYAIQNITSDRNAGSLSIPVPNGATITNIGFKSPAYMNGESYTNAPWTATVANGMLTWSCEPNTNVNANAVRWATLYNFRFETNVPPATENGSATVGLWKAPTASSPETSLGITARIPGALPSKPGDFNNDGVVDASDLTLLLAAWGGTGGDLNNDGVTNASDITILLANWG